VRTVIAFFLLFHPSLSSKFPPGWYRTQYNLLANGKREILNELAREIVALMAPFDTFLNCTSPDGTGATEYEQFIGEAALTLNLIYSYTVNSGQSLLKLDIVIPVGNKNCTNTAV